MKNPEKDRYQKYEEIYATSTETMHRETPQAAPAGNTKGAQTKKTVYGKDTVSKQGMANIKAGSKAE